MTDTVLAEGARVVTFANGVVVREQIVTISDDLRRLSYAAVGGRASHHNAYFQVFAGEKGGTRLLWVTDLLPDEARAPIAGMVDAGVTAIQQTIEQTFRETR